MWMGWMSESKGSKKMTVQRVKERRGGGGRDKEVERTRKEESGTSTWVCVWVGGWKQL